MTEWISVKERKPKHEQTVLWYVPDRFLSNIYIGTYEIYGTEEYIEIVPVIPELFLFHITHTTHWAELPAPPLEDL